MFIAEEGGMRRPELILLLAALYGPLASCSAVTDFVVNKQGTRKFDTSDPVFDKYVARFEELGRYHTQKPFFIVGDIPINFGDTENPNYDGVCFSYANGEKEIIIKKSWWDKQEKSDKDKEDSKGGYSLIRESLLFHELGHCRLGRKHEERMVYGNVKRSMMSPNVVNSNDYRRYKEGYWEELFTGSTDKLLESLDKPVK